MIYLGGNGSLIFLSYPMIGKMLKMCLLISLWVLGFSYAQIYAGQGALSSNSWEN